MLKIYSCFGTSKQFGAPQTTNRSCGGVKNHSPITVAFSPGRQGVKAENQQQNQHLTQKQKRTT